MVSVPAHLNASQIYQALARRVSWAIAHHPQVLEQHQRRQNALSDPLDADNSVYLWGKVQSFTFSHDEKIAYYRQQLSTVMPSLFETWQPIVGTYANEVRVKKMHTRWGSCNTRAKRVWLSVYLPAYPIECTEYVIVHELCHLHHANHSAAFWQTVATAMPDYQHWHDMLAGRTGQLD